MILLNVRTLGGCHGFEDVCVNTCVWLDQVLDNSSSLFGVRIIFFVYTTIENRILGILKQLLEC